MKKAFNISSLQQGALCNLCQDTLLRHVGGQGRVYWYCPSCRQETVGKEPAPAIATHFAPPTPQQPLTKIPANSSKLMGVRAS